MYDPDPFAAKKMVQERQTKASEKREAVAAAASETTPGSREASLAAREFERYPEVKMAPELRAMVEDSIKQVCARPFLPLCILTSR